MALNGITLTWRLSSFLCVKISTTPTQVGPENMMRIAEQSVPCQYSRDLLSRHSIVYGLNTLPDLWSWKRSDPPDLSHAIERGTTTGFHRVLSDTLPLLAFGRAESGTGDDSSTFFHCDQLVHGNIRDSLPFTIRPAHAELRRGSVSKSEMEAGVIAGHEARLTLHFLGLDAASRLFCPTASDDAAVEFDTLLP